MRWGIWRQPNQSETKCTVLFCPGKMCTLGFMEWLFFVLFCVVFDFVDGWMEFACRLYFSLLLSLSRSLVLYLSLLLYILLSLLVVVSFCLLSVSVSFSVSIDRSCIRLLSPFVLFIVFCVGCLGEEMRPHR